MPSPSADTPEGAESPSSLERGGTQGITRAGADPRDTRAATTPRSHRELIMTLLAIGGGGLLGAVARYALYLALPTEPGKFPWGTFTINLSGSAALGFLLVVLIERFPGGRLARPMLGTGFIGAFTTFSTFVVEGVLLVREGDPGMAAVYLISSLLGGLGSAWLGVAVARISIGIERRRQVGR